MVTPNALSPLGTKKVLVLEGGSISGDHLSARTATYTNLQSFANQVKFTLSKGDPLNLTDANLAAIDIIVFNYFFETQNATAFSDNSKAAFQRWLAKGNKGYVGYHTSGANEWLKNEWPWYQDNVTSMRYALHGSGTPLGNLSRTTDAAVLQHPIMQGLPATISANDEWYAFDATSKVLDTASHCKVMYYLTNAQALDRQPFENHPVAWFREDAAKTRYFYATFVHFPDGANATWFKSILLRALEYVSGDPVVPLLQSQGKTAITNAGLSFITSNRELKIAAAGPFQISLYNMHGALLYQTSGAGPTILTPETFSQAGQYTIVLHTGEKTISQRILIY
jgi:type 1 glutamine amidotransferase